MNKNINLVKTGGCSIVIGEGHYGRYIPKKTNKLVKITKIIKNHNEFQHLDKIREIKNYDEYYSIPDKEIFMLFPEHDFYQYIKRLALIDNLNIFQGSIQYSYINFAGYNDLLDSIVNMMDSNSLQYWKSYKVIDRLGHHILMGLNFLHQKQIAHLDIKPENIMIDMERNTFKIIDFGFCSIYPFDEFIADPRGTPGYFPKHYPSTKQEIWLPEIDADDFQVDNSGGFPCKYDRSFVYKTDSFCLGRVLYFLKYIYDDLKIYYCYNSESHLGSKLNGIIDSLLDKNVYKRITINECLSLYY